MGISIMTSTMQEVQQAHCPKRRNLVLAQNPTAELHPTANLSHPSQQMMRPLAILVGSSLEYKFMQTSKSRFVRSKSDVLRSVLKHAPMFTL